MDMLAEIVSLPWNLGESTNRDQEFQNGRLIFLGILDRDWPARTSSNVHVLTFLYVSLA